jgi:hypothetical protein
MKPVASSPSAHKNASKVLSIEALIASQTVVQRHLDSTSFTV